MPDQLYQAQFKHRGGGWVCSGAVVVDGRIVETGGVIGRFTGQLIGNLERWVTGLGGEVTLIR